MARVEGLVADAPETGVPEDDADVPAAVLCAYCGRADCGGCVKAERTAREGETPWEARELPFWRRLIGTAHLATADGEAFFGGLRDGSVSDALYFALSCELLAIGSLAFLWIPLVYAFVPGYFVSLFSDGERRRRLDRKRRGHRRRTGT